VEIALSTLSVSVFPTIMRSTSLSGLSWFLAMEPYINAYLTPLRPRSVFWRMKNRSSAWVEPAQNLGSQPRSEKLMKLHRNSFGYKMKRLILKTVGVAEAIHDSLLSIQDRVEHAADLILTPYKGPLNVGGPATVIVIRISRYDKNSL
jgi:hypothetical protein